MACRIKNRSKSEGPGNGFIARSTRTSRYGIKSKQTAIERRKHPYRADRMKLRGLLKQESGNGLRLGWRSQEKR